MILYSILFSLWPCLFILLQETTQCSQKIIRNYLSFGHSISASILSYGSILFGYPEIIQQLVVNLSISYFVWDTLYIMIKRDWSELPYIYHHVIITWMLLNVNLQINSDLFTYVLFLGEFSNIFNYIVYHMIKQQYDNWYLILVKIIQVLWFSYFRMYRLTSVFYYDFHKLSGYLLPYNLVVIYVMGVIWGYKQLQSTIKNIEQYNSVTITTPLKKIK